jgi:hypothetical protein
MNTLHQQYKGREQRGGTFEDKDRLLIKLLAEERNCWISGCCLALWIGVHRYRSLLKKYYRLEDERSKMPELGGVSGPAQVMPVPVAVEATINTTSNPAVKKDQ